MSVSPEHIRTRQRRKNGRLGLLLYPGLDVDSFEYLVDRSSPPAESVFLAEGGTGVAFLRRSLQLVYRSVYFFINGSPLGPIQKSDVLILIYIKISLF